MKHLFICLATILIGASSAVAEGSSCICDCSYPRSDRIKNHKYFEADGRGCAVIEGKACIGTHRGETFRGLIKNCETGAKEFGALTFDILADQPATFSQVVARSEERKVAR